MTTTYLVDGKPMTEAEFAQRLRDRYVENPPEGYTSEEISRMKDEVKIMTTTYLVDGKPMTEAEFAQRLRDRYVENPPEGYTSEEISRMKDDDILDMDYFLHE